MGVHKRYVKGSDVDAGVTLFRFIVAVTILAHTLLPTVPRPHAESSSRELRHEQGYGQ